jgi:hypothetical protein
MLEGRKRRWLEKRRRETLSDVRGERLSVEIMVQRAEQAGEIPDATFLKSLYDRLTEIEQRTNNETNTDELDSLSGDAQQQGQLRAYICPLAEILLEGTMSIDRMEEWKVPKAVITNLRGSLVSHLQMADTKPDKARSALRAVFQEYDSWANYTDDYEETLKKFTRGLAAATLATLLLASAIVLWWPSIALFALLLAGAAGSCVSIMWKMPMLEVSPSGELEAYQRRIWTRIGVGVAAGVIGCAMLGWGLLPISIQERTFASVLNACTSSPVASCTSLNALIFLGVPMLLGFSERALTSFEGPMFGHDRRTPTPSEQRDFP